MSVWTEDTKLFKNFDIEARCLHIHYHFLPLKLKGLLGLGYFYWFSVFVLLYPDPIFLKLCLYVEKDNKREQTGCPLWVLALFYTFTSPLQ